MSATRRELAEPGLSGGGAQVEPAVVPSSGPHTELEALELDLVVSEQRLDAELLQVSALIPEDDRWASPPLPEPFPASTGTVGSSEPPPGSTVRPPAPPPSTALWGETGTPCDLACRALASMRRSADGICRLAGAGSERCDGARGRVARASERVAAAGCVCTIG
jgi:hypothetical protein